MKLFPMIVGLAMAPLMATTVMATTVMAAVYVPGDGNFSITIPPGYTLSDTPVISGFLGVTPGAAGVFTDDFYEIIPQNGTETGSITTTANAVGSTNYIKLLSVTFNLMPIAIVTSVLPDGGIQQTAGFSNAPILADVRNDLQVTYSSPGAGSYGGQITFDAAAVPEPATWVSLMLGLGLAGLGLRRRLGTAAGRGVAFALA